MLNIPVSLSDLSTKKINECNLSNHILALVKGTSFYERFGFRNEVYKNLYGASKTLIPNTFYEKDEALDFYKKVKRYPGFEKEINAFENKILTYEDVAQFIYNLCVTNHALTNLNSFYYFKELFLIVIKEIFNPSEDYKTFTKAVPEYDFDFNLRKTMEGDTLVVHVENLRPINIDRGGSRRKKKTEKKRKRRLSRAFK
jgi:hypothetical protein